MNATFKKVLKLVIAGATCFVAGQCFGIASAEGLVADGKVSTDDIKKAAKGHDWSRNSVTDGFCEGFITGGAEMTRKLEDAGLL